MKAVKAVTDVDTNLGSYKASLDESGMSPSQIAAVQNGVENLAYAKSLFGHSAGDVAAKDAVQAFVGKYEFQPPSGTGVVRIPKQIYDAVSGNAEIGLDRMSKDDVVAPALFGQKGQRTVEDYIASIKANPHWLTSPQSDALWLKDNQNGIVMGRDGKPWAVPYAAAAPASRVISPSTGLLTRPELMQAAQPAQPVALPQPQPATTPAATAASIRG